MLLGFSSQPRISREPPAQRARDVTPDFVSMRMPLVSRLSQNRKSQPHIVVVDRLTWIQAQRLAEEVQRCVNVASVEALSPSFVALPCQRYRIRSLLDSLAREYLHRLATGLGDRLWWHGSRQRSWKIRKCDWIAFR